MFIGFFVWIFLVHRIHNTFSGEPPLITTFLADDLTRPGDVTSQLGFQLPCEASGTSPLRYRWQVNGTDIKYGEHYRLLPTGTLVGRSLDQGNDGKYQCFVKNDFGMDFSRKMQVKVTVLGDFYFEDDKVAPVSLGKPIEIHCPEHKPSYGVRYRWGGFHPAYPDVFRSFPENERIAVTLEGTLVIMFVTLQDAKKVNTTRGIVCEMATDENETYSHAVTFKLDGDEFTGNKTPEIYFSPKLMEAAIEGAEKKLYCLGVAKPPPNITWAKDGETIEDGQHNFHLPAKHFGRLLVITKVEKEHQGTYTCTVSSSDGSFVQASKTTVLTVKVSPRWEVPLPSKTIAEKSKTKLLSCLARADPKPRYRWFRNGKEINMSSFQIKLQGSDLQLEDVDSWHEAVYQCVAENSLGMNVTSTWVKVQVPAISSEKESSGVRLWLIVCAILGGLLIVALVVLLICYKRRKARRNEERPRVTEEAGTYNDIFNENNGSQPLPDAQTVPSMAPRVHGVQRRPTLPPLPQYQSLKPSTVGMDCYQPLGPHQDQDDSGLYERLDFRTINDAHNYDNPGKVNPIPEYLELVSDTNVPPVNTASNMPTGGPGKEYYEPMENDNNATPSDQPRDMEAPNVKRPVEAGPGSPKYYEPMSAEPSIAKSPPSSSKYYEPMSTNITHDPSMKTKGSTALADYYQPMADNVSSGKLSPSPQEYYVPMSENSLGTSEAQTSHVSPEFSDKAKVDGNHSKL